MDAWYAGRWGKIAELALLTTLGAALFQGVLILVVGTAASLAGAGGFGLALAWLLFRWEGLLGGYLLFWLLLYLFIFREKPSSTEVVGRVVP